MVLVQNYFFQKYSKIENAAQPHQRDSLCLNFPHGLSLLSCCNSLLWSLPSGSPILAGCFEQAIREGFTVADKKKKEEKIVCVQISTVCALLKRQRL